MKKIINVLLVCGFILSIIACNSSVDAGGVNNEIENTIPVEKVTIQRGVATTLTAGQTIQLSAEILPENATEKTIIWTSDNEACASVSENGLVTAKKETASVKITATSKAGNKSDTLVFKIIKADTSIQIKSLTITNTEISLEAGSTLQLNVAIEPDNATNKLLTWTSSNSDYATISDTGLVTAVAETQSVTFTATTQDGSDLSASYSLSITPKTLKPELQYAQVPYTSETKYRVTGIGTWVAPEVIIPETYNGYPVTEIYDAAFKNNKNITSVIIGKNVTKIGKEVFYGCSNISEITIPEKVTEVAYLNSGDKGAFDNMEKLKTIYFNAENMPEYSYYSYPLVPPSVETVYIGKTVSVIPKYFCKGANVQKVIFAEDCECTKIMDSAFTECKLLASITLPENLESIGYSCFSGCEALRNVYFPSKLKHISGYSFENCISLEAVNLPESITSCTGSNVFKNATAIKTFTFNSNITPESYVRGFCDGIGSEEAHTEIIFSDKVTAITGNVIGAANYVEKITIGKNVETIGDKAFYGFPALKTIVYNAKNATLPAKSKAYVFYNSGSTSANGVECIFGKDVEKIPDYLFFDSEDIYASSSGKELKYITKITFEEGSKCTTIGSYAFRAIPELTSISLPSTITTIGEHAFQNTGLTSLVLPDSIKEVGQYAFADCNSIESVDLKNIEVIYSYAFQNNTSLKKLMLPSSVRVCYKEAFYNSRNLEEIDFNAPDLVQTYKDSSGNLKYDKCGSIISLKSDNDPKASSLVLKLSSQITTIPRELFGDSNITQIDWGENSNVKQIDYRAFKGSTRLIEINLPDSVETIDSSAFERCIEVQKIYIKENVKTIASRAFADLPKVTDIYFYPKNIEDIEWSSSPFGTSYYDLKEIATNQRIILHIGKDVERIPANYFYSNGGYFNLEEVRFAPGSKCTEIGSKALQQTSTFTTLYLPKTITKIGDNIFYDKTNVKNIYFEGSTTEWNNITFGNYNTNRNKANIHYNSTLIE